MASKRPVTSQASRGKSSMTGKADSSFRRFLVESVEKAENGTILKMKPISSNEIYECHLSGKWCEVQVSGGAIIHIRSDSFYEENPKKALVNDQIGAIVINPDNLIRVTDLKRGCIRKSWLNILLRDILGWDSFSSLKGQLVEKIFQNASLDFQPKMGEKLEEIKNSCLNDKKFIEKLVHANISKDEMEEALDEFLAFVLQGLENLSRYESPDKIIDIEEVIWSPSQGIIGEVDLSLNAMIDGMKMRIPLELKTGEVNRYEEDNNQVKLYSMLMKERGSDRCDRGFLLPLGGGKGKWVEELKKRMIPNTPQMIKMQDGDENYFLRKRNRLAYYSSPNRKELTGPEFIDEKNKNNCSKCPQKFACSLLAESFEKDKIRSKFRKNFIRKLISHLNSEDIDYFKEEFLSLVTSDGIGGKMKPNFWTEVSSSREKARSGLRKLKLSTTKESGIIYLKPSGTLSKEDGSFAQFENRQVVISEDESSEEIPTKVALLRGTVQKVDENGIEIQLTKGKKVHIPEKFKGKTYRLDIEDYDDLPALNKLNLIKLMRNEDRSKKLRDIIIRKPSLSWAVKSADQKEAIASKILSEMKDYHLIETPSPGKTVAGMVRIIRQAKKSVLISSYDHQTLNRISRSLKESGIEYVLFGRRSLIPNDIRGNLNRELTENMNTEEELAKFYKNVDVAAVSCYGVSYDAFFRRKRFDFCIIVGALNAPLIASLGPLLISDKFVLIADEKKPKPKKKSGKRGIGKQTNRSNESLFGLLNRNGVPISIMTDKKT